MSSCVGSADTISGLWHAQCQADLCGTFQNRAVLLVMCSESVGLERVAEYWHSVIQINDYQKNRFVERIISGMFNTVSGKKIAILGFAFKKVT